MPVEEGQGGKALRDTTSCPTGGNSSSASPLRAVRSRQFRSSRIGTKTSASPSRAHVPDHRRCRGLQQVAAPDKWTAIGGVRSYSKSFSDNRRIADPRVGAD